MASGSASRYLIGVFASWQALAIAVAALAERFEIERRLTILAMADTFQDPGATEMLKAASSRWREALTARRDLKLVGGSAAIVCTPGPLADLLERRVHDGCLQLADALSMWMFPQQARELAEDVQRGHILLWVRLFASDPEQDISETLLANGPLRIEVHDLMPPVKV